MNGISRTKDFFKFLITGAVTGLVNGLFGSGGGTVLILAMQRFLKIEVHKSHATAIAVILPLSLLSGFIYLRGTEIDWYTLLYVSLGGVAGGYVGAKMLKKISKNGLHKLFGIFMIIAAIKMIWG